MLHSRDLEPNTATAALLEELERRGYDRSFRNGSLLRNPNLELKEDAQKLSADTNSLTSVRCREVL